MKRQKAKTKTQAAARKPMPSLDECPDCGKEIRWEGSIGQCDCSTGREREIQDIREEIREFEERVRAFGEQGSGMEDIKAALREFMVDRDDKAFDLLWKSFTARVGISRTAHGAEPMPGHVHPPGYARRAENLRSALHAMHRDDWHVLSSLCTQSTPRDDGEKEKQPSVQPEVFRELMSRLEDAAEALRDFQFNKPHRTPSFDVPMCSAMTMWRDHIGGKIGANEEGPFARFVRLFFRAIDPAWQHRTDSLQGRIRKARKDYIELGDFDTLWDCVPMPSVHAGRQEGDKSRK